MGGEEWSVKDRKMKKIKKIFFGRTHDRGHGWGRVAIKRALRRLLQRLQCSIGSSLSWINHNQVNARSCILTYIYVFIRKTQRISWMNLFFLFCHIILENQKTWSNVFLWRTVLRSFRKVREKSDKFVRHFQGQPFRSPHRGQMLLCYLPRAFSLTLWWITGIRYFKHICF